MDQACTDDAALAAGEDIDIGGERGLDFSRPFLPESLARVAPLELLDPHDKLRLNQIRGLGYLSMFGLVEEFVLPAEEAGHVHLFRRFREEFERGFGTSCAVIEPEAIARPVLAHQPLAVALLGLQIEWMTQRHYVASVRDAQGLDPLFRSLLRRHWMAEARHARLDTLKVRDLAADLTVAGIERAIEEYLEIAMLVDGGLAEQAELDVASLERATGRPLGPAQRAEVLAVQQQAQRWTFLGSGMMHPSFLATAETLHPLARPRIEQMAVAMS